MAKLNYVEGDYKEALNIYARVGLDDLPLTAVPPYRLRVLAEAYATKGEACASVPGGCPPGPCPLEPAQPPPWDPWLGMGSQQGAGLGPRLALGNVRPSNTRFPQSLGLQLSLRKGENNISAKFSGN